ncbi:MAG: hypothetical protein ABIQ16_06710 [Polyangiaceae bacterium]
MKRNKRSLRAVAFVASSVLAAGASCSKVGADRGGLVLVVTKEGALTLDELDILVTSKGKTLLDRHYRVPDETALPTSLGITSNGSSTATVEFTVVAWKSGVALDRRDAIVTQVPADRVAELRIVLSGSCAAQVLTHEDHQAESKCGVGATCDPTSGLCTDAAVNASNLPVFQPGADLAGDAGAPTAGASSSGATGGLAGMGEDAGAGGSGDVGGEAGVPSTAGTSTGGTSGGDANAGIDGGGTSGGGTSGGGSGACTGSPCVGTTPVCLNGQCVECQPNATPDQCLDQTPTYCNTEGKRTAVAGGACPASKKCTTGQCACAVDTCSGLCTTVASDSLNCGLCGHSCQSGTCNSGVCQPVPIATNAGSPTGILMTATGDLYWVNGAGLIKRSSTGGVSQVLLPGTLSCGTLYGPGLASDATKLYFCGENACSLPLSGSNPQPVDLGGNVYSGSTNLLQGIAVNSTAVYVGNPYDVWLESSTQGTHQLNPNTVLGVAADASNVYWLEKGGSTMSVVKHIATGITTAGTALATSQAISEGIAVYAGYVYWTGAASPTAATGTVSRISIAGGTVEPIANGQINPGGITADANGVYWVNRGSTGSVMRTALTGGMTPITLASGQNTPRGITTDATTVYWTNTAASTVMKVAK